jgi:hypothetical protein
VEAEPEHAIMAPMSAWTLDELKKLQRTYGSRTDAKVARSLGRTVEEVKAKAEELALAKDKAAFPGVRKMPRWSTEELEKLRALYPTTANVDIARELGRSLKSVVSKGCALGLRKEHERLRDMGRRNVQLRRDRMRGAG